MKIYPLFCDGTLINGAEDVRSGPSENSLNRIIGRCKEGQSYLHSLDIDDILSWLNEASSQWAKRESPIQQEFGHQGINYLLMWFRKKHLGGLLDAALRGNRQVLDRFCDLEYLPYKLSAQPKGVVAHWLAGNVPMLGMLSLIQGLVTKNANIVKVPSSNGHVIPNLLASLRTIDHTTANGTCISGEKLLASVAAVYFDRTDTDAHRALSNAASVRVAWGGSEAVESVMNLPRQYGTHDVIFGPKTSFAVIGRERLASEDQVRKIARACAHDASLFEQQGCNAPHTIFVEEGGAISSEQFAQALALEMEGADKRLPRDMANLPDTNTVLSLRAEYDIRGQAFYPKSVAWSVLHDVSDRGLAIPHYHRTLFVRPVADIMDVAQHCSHLTQSAGIALSDDRKETFARTVTAKGIERCPDVGSMSLYDSPWDGMFVPDHFVRWCKL